jgi:hypothetical protein
MTDPEVEPVAVVAETQAQAKIAAAEEGRLVSRSRSRAHFGVMQVRLPNPALALSLMLFAALALPGCWTPPRSDLQPPGEPRLIADHIRAQSKEHRALVQAVDAQSRTLRLVSATRRSPSTYPVSPYVSGLGQIKPGDRIQATVLDELSVYVLHADEPAFIGGKRIEADARVLSVDPSYRLLTVQYPDGGRKTFKVGLGAKLEAVQAGDSVVIRAVELAALKRRK